jgi:putative cell wall-binding protein
VVLARSDHFADALAGGPLAASLDAPILLNPPSGLDARVLAEIRRVLPAGGEVHLLGGTASLSPAVASALTAAGYDVHRHAGADRYATAVAIARSIGSPARLLLVSGRDFPDGLSAGAAAARLGAAVLLTDGGVLPAATRSYLDDHLGTPVTAVGGPAAAARPAASSIVGSDRYETARLVADQLFPGEVAWAGLASGERFPDALVAAAHLGRLGGPLLLTPTASISVAVSAWLRTHVTGHVVVYGGTTAVTWSGWTD